MSTYNIIEIARTFRRMPLKPWRELHGHYRDGFDFLRDALNKAESKAEAVSGAMADLHLYGQHHGEREAALWLLQAAFEERFEIVSGDDPDHVRYRPLVRDACCELVVRIDRNPYRALVTAQVIVQPDRPELSSTLLGVDITGNGDSPKPGLALNDDTIDWVCKSLEDWLGSEEHCELVGEVHQAQWVDWAAMELAKAMERDLHAVDDEYDTELTHELVALLTDRSLMAGDALVEGYGWSGSLEDCHMMPDMSKPAKWKVASIHQALQKIRDIDPLPVDLEVQIG